MNTPLIRVIIFVSDVQACAAFYTDIFDFKPLHTDDPAGWQELDTGGCRLAFHKVHGFTGPTGSQDNPHKVVFHTNDVAAARKRAIDRGATMGKLKTFGALTLCDGQDIEGHVFQLSNRP